MFHLHHLCTGRRKSSPKHLPPPVCHSLSPHYLVLSSSGPRVCPGTQLLPQVRLSPLLSALQDIIARMRNHGILTLYFHRIQKEVGGENRLINRKYSKTQLGHSTGWMLFWSILSVPAWAPFPQQWIPAPAGFNKGSEKWYHSVWAGDLSRLSDKNIHTCTSVIA